MNIFNKKQGKRYINLMIFQKVMVTILCLFVATNLFGQNSKVDSLEQIAVSNKRDTTQVKILNSLSSYYLRRDLEKSLKYAKKSITVAEEIKNYHGLGVALSSATVAYMDMGKTDTAAIYLLKALKILESIKDENVDISLANAYALKGHLENNKNNADKAFELFLKAAKICEQSTDPSAKNVLPVHYNNLANLFKNKKEYDKGLKYALKALKAAENSNALTKSVLMSTVGRLYVNLEQSDKALTYFDDALKLKKEIDDKVGMITLLSAIANVYFDRKDYSKAKLKYEEVERLTNEANYIQGKFISQFNFAKLHYAQKDYQKAIQRSKNVLEIANENETDAKMYLEEVYHILAKSYAALRQFEAAYTYQVEYSTIQDTINKQNQMEHINELETQYEVEKKERENEYLKAEQSKNQTILTQRNYLIMGAILTILLLTILASVLFRSNRLKKSHNQILEQTVAERTSELKIANENLAKSNKDLGQLNYELRTFNYIASHDIKEPIRVIGGYIGLVFRKLPNDLKENLGEYFDTIKRSTNQLYTLIEDFANYTTLSKNETIEKQTVDLNLLVANIVDSLQETIKKQNGTVENTALPVIQSSNSLLFTTLKNLIENGLKYNKSETPTVKVDYNKTEVHHEIIVSDNGIGIEKQYHEQIFEMFKRLHNRGAYEGSGIGLAIVKLSVEKLGGTIRLESEEGQGSRFVIELPMI